MAALFLAGASWCVRRWRLQRSSMPAATLLPPVSIGRLDRAISAMADSSASLPDDMTAAADAWLYITRGITPGSLPHPTRDSLLRAGRDSRAFAVFAPDVERLLPLCGRLRPPSVSSTAFRQGSMAWFPLQPERGHGRHGGDSGAQSLPWLRL